MVMNCLEVIKGLLDSHEAYLALNTPESDWDEYDHMMFPRWIAARKLVDNAEV
jgi:hypothetical protein